MKNSSNSKKRMDKRDEIELVRSLEDAVILLVERFEKKHRVTVGYNFTVGQIRK